MAKGRVVIVYDDVDSVTDNGDEFIVRRVIKDENGQKCFEVLTFYGFSHTSTIWEFEEDDVNG